MEKIMEQRLFEDYNSHLDHSGVKGKRIGERLLSIARIGFTAEGGSCRIGYSEEERQAKELIKEWMSEIGLEITEDAAGNVVGRLTGKKDELPAIMSGSHIDSVPNGGHFDGVLGILTILEVFEAWKETNYQPIRPFEVVIFSDEEGSQFNAGLTGSKAMMGEVDLVELSSLKDHEGITFEEVINKNGLVMDKFIEAARESKELAAFVEVHIEQGKQLEKYNEPVGIVTGIAGQVGLEFSFKGMAGHAGNTPMADRQDALVAASEFILSIRSLPEKVSASAVATVGRLHVFPNGSNVIPGEVRLSVDIRDIYPDTLEQLVSSVVSEAERMARNHKNQIDWQETLKINPVPIQKQMQELQAESLLENQIQPAYIPSGAGHDAMVLGAHLPIAMFFVRSKDGISHHPDEWSSLSDCVAAVHVLKNFLKKLQLSI